MADITMPQLGETVTEGTITKWYKQVGDAVAADEALFEVSTDKVDTDVPSPVAGVVAEILAPEGQTVGVGAVIARVGANGAPAPSAPAPAPAPSAPAPAPAPSEPAPVPAPAAMPAAPSAPSAPSAPTPSATSVPAGRSGDDVVVSPVVRRLITENGVDVSRLVGSGLGGRITRGDVEKYLQSRPTQQPPASAASARTAAVAPASRVTARQGDTTEPFSNIRRRTAEHMVMSKQTSPHVLTAIEVDFERVERVRRAHRESWKATEGFSLTYLPFITRALCDALREFPRLNASVGEGELIVHGDVNVAIAVDLNFEGLLAPVLRAADGKRLRAIAREIVDLASRARSRKLGADDIMGGTFTITNPGQYGTLMQFPIINQPQVAILSTDGIRRRPVVITDAEGNESIGIHSVGVLALAWDHRAFDGAYAAAFLDKLRTIIETHDWDAELA